MVSILHISDLHFIRNADGFNMHEVLIREAMERVRERPHDEKLLVVTGDFHNFGDVDYQNAIDFMDRLTKAMDIEPSKDVFVIPGNHDVANDELMEKWYGKTAPDWRKRKRGGTTEHQGQRLGLPRRPTGVLRTLLRVRARDWRVPGRGRLRWRHDPRADPRSQLARQAQHPAPQHGTDRGRDGEGRPARGRDDGG